MITKLYERIKKIIKENYLFFLTLFILTILFYIPLPYYIYAPGGLVDVEDRFQVQNAYHSEGSFHLTYVSEYTATIPLYTIALLKKDWDITKKSEVVASNETVEENDLRSHLLLEETNGNAIINAYSLASKKVVIKEQKLLVSYVDPEAKTDLKIGDQILKVEDKTVNTKYDVKEYLEKFKKDDTIHFTILRNNQTKEATATLVEISNNLKVGIVLTNNYQFETTPKIKFTFKQNESGPSGGFMMSLAIYNALVEEDITHGLKIAGTGTIEEDGSVGEIGGIEYKIKSAEKEKADIFFAPTGKNYKTAKKIAEENHYHIKVVEATSLKDALDYLANLKS